MHRVVSYKVVVASRPGMLESLVKQEIAEGWVPSGSIVVFEAHVMQAMVKFAEA